MHLAVPTHDRVEVSAADRGGGVVLLRLDFIRSDGDMMQSLSIGLVPESAARLRHEIGVALDDMAKRQEFHKVGRKARREARP